MAEEAKRGLLICPRAKVNNGVVSIVTQRMMLGSMPGKLGMVVVIVLIVFVSTARPLAHPAGRFFPQFQGLTRMSLLSESPDTDSQPVPAPAADVHLVDLPLVIGLLLFTLKARRAVFRPIPLRRLKLPARSAKRDAIPSD